MNGICKTVGCDHPVWATKLCKSCYRKHRWRKNLKVSRARARAKARRERRADPEKFRNRTNLWHKQHREYDAVANHYNIIIRNPAPAYTGLPFFAEWNPNKGGTIKKGEQWILTNLGPRPSNHHDLHIVDRRLGFVPGNLQWMPRSAHAQHELISQLLLDVQNLKIENALLKAAQ